MDRQASEQRGRRAETIAAWWLAAKGYRVLARRAATPWGEIDLVCRQGDCVVFVEVKARPSLTAALEALGPRQRRRIADAARRFLGRHPRWQVSTAASTWSPSAASACRIISSTPGSRAGSSRVALEPSSLEVDDHLLSAPSNVSGVA
ncbi:MAG: YraN family protein [Geminicoccaceae bacterium]